jgi:chorismate lyase / 3-hydroxybenzoate synthase
MIASRFVHIDEACEGGVLARIVFGESSGRPCLDDGVPTLRLRMAGHVRDGFAEIWRSDAPVQSGAFNDLVFAHDGEFLFCAGFIASSDRYTEATRKAYGDAFALVRELNFPKIFRMWNFIPDINDENAEGLEVYRDFCRGRAIAFEEDYAGASGMPAATGIGTWGDGVGFYFLACRESAIRHVENARQTPAYEYPQRYGPKAPSFARGTQLRDTLFVSGTASILGHETVHAGDLHKQWDVAVANIAHLIGTQHYALRDLDQIKVYYRRATDLPAVMTLAARAFHADANIRYLKVDVCRADLLVEIEGIATRRLRSD